MLLTRHAEIAFNAGVLGESVVMDVKDYARISGEDCAEIVRE